MNYESILLWSYLALLIAFIVIILGNWYYFKFIYVCVKKEKTFQKANIFYKYVVLIPARNESKVIKNILNSLKKQSYDSSLFDVYVITESEEDPTNKIALSYGYHYIVRKRLENRRTKGYALQEAYEYLKENKVEYDAAIVFDADNILSPHYISLLNDIKAEGYEIGVGLRESTNSNVNYVSASSALLFTFQSRFVNKARSILFDKVTISGTGYFIDKKIIDDAGTWVWTGLTEDVDLTRYAYMNGIKMGYNQKAIYYDEQPINFATLHKQHVRWIWGYISKGIVELAKKSPAKYSKPSKLAKWEYFHAIDLFQFSEWVVLFHIFVLIGFMIHFSIIERFDLYILYGPFIAVDILIMFLICDIAQLIELIFSGKHFKVSNKLKVQCVLFGFVFWADWLFGWLDGFFHPKKRKVWVEIEHKGEKINTKK